HWLGVENSLRTAKDLGNIKVLVAEDNLVYRMMLRKILLIWDVGQVAFAADGEEAIQLSDSTAVDCRLSDLQLQEKNGYELASSTRNLSDTVKCDIPIIALTATSFEEVKDQLEVAGIDDFISKPFIPDDLLSKLIKYL